MLNLMMSMKTKLMFFFIMSIFVWNCQGAGGRVFPSVVKNYVTQYRHLLVVLVEPSINGGKTDEVVSKLKFSNSRTVAASGFSRVYGLCGMMM